MSFFEQQKIMVPVLDVLDLKVAAQTIKPEQTFTFLSRCIFQISWAAATKVFTQFGADAALTNGINLTYIKHEILPDTLKDMNSFSLYAYDTRVDTDTGAAPSHIMSSRFSFWKFTHDSRGLRLSPYREFGIVLKDDLSSSNNAIIKVVLEGWRLE